MIAQEVLDKLEEAVKDSTVGLELWLPKDGYDKLVKTGKITFNEFISSRIMS